MNLEDYIQSLYEQTYKTSALPNFNKLSQDLMKILSYIYNDQNTLEKQFKYLKTRIIESCELILQNMDVVEEKKKDSDFWAFALLAGSGDEVKLLDPVMTQKQEKLLSANVDKFNKAKEDGYTHKKWNWTGAGSTTRHTSNDQQIVPIDEPFTIINDSNGQVANLMFPGDVQNDPTGSNSVICYCDVSFEKTNIAKHRLNSITETNINGTILIDNQPVYNTQHPWKLSAGALKETYNQLKKSLPLNVELTHLMQLDVDKPVMDALDLDKVVTINDVELIDESKIVITDSTINNAEIVSLAKQSLINGISINYIDPNDDINDSLKSKPLTIISSSLVKIPACPRCEIKMAKQNNDGEDIMNQEDLKMISDLIAESLKGFKEELLAINKPEEEEEELVEDNVKTRAQLKAEVEEELAIKKLDEDANALVDNLVQQGVVSPIDHSANVLLAKANYDEYSKIMSAKHINPIYGRIIDADDVVENKDAFKVLNAKFRNGEL